MVKIANKVVVLLCGILVCMLSIGICDSMDHLAYQDKNACQAYCQELIDNGQPGMEALGNVAPSVEECTKDTCGFVGSFCNLTENYREAIPYFERAIALGDNEAYYLLGFAYYSLNAYFSAKKYYEIGCNKVSEAQSISCYKLGVMYVKGQGVRQDYHKAVELYKKACEMKHDTACNNLGFLYENGQGVRQNLSIAKQYYGKACDLGIQLDCDNYKLLNNQGVQ
ncbi:tetratricopeptide repeat protein [Helicobacter sp. T3_23-1059]